VEGTGYAMQDVFGAGAAMPLAQSESSSESVSKVLPEAGAAAMQTEEEAREFAGDKTRATTIRILVELLKAKLPTEQAIAAAYRIYDSGKTHGELIKEVEKYLKE
jgi:hypothetical protein